MKEETSCPSRLAIQDYRRPQFGDPHPVPEYSYHRIREEAAVAYRAARAAEPDSPLPEPSGGTDMSLALDYVARLAPRHAIVISDGGPSDPKATLASARALNCVISTFYCGEETNRSAIAFLKQLALCSRGGVGRPMIADLCKPEKLTAELRLLPTGPAAS